jgi:hypothetical protein
MGKGKGMIERKVIRIRRGMILLEFSGVPPFKLNLLLPKLNRKLDIKLAIINNSFISYNIWSINKYYYYHNKYLLN